MFTHARSPRSISVARPPENYLASVSDLMVGLLFLFILMLMTLALDVRAPVPAPSRPGAAAAYDARDKAILDIQQELKGRGVIVQVNLRDGIIRLPESLLFDPGQARLRPDGQVALKRVSSELMYFLPHCPQLESVVVEGHTDDRPVHGAVADALGIYRDNWDLAYLRAKETFQGLVAATPALGRLQNDRGLHVLAMGAFGPDRPVGDNRTEAGRQLNRRIDLRVVLAAPKPMTTRSTN
jgi:flagellar motor protein MotB